RGGDARPDARHRDVTADRQFRRLVDHRHQRLGAVGVLGLRARRPDLRCLSRLEGRAPRSGASSALRIACLAISDVNCFARISCNHLRRILMIRRINGRHVWLTAFACAAALTIASPLTAQSTGMVKGTVKDDKGQAVDGAKIIIEFAEGVNRKQETKTNKKGEFVQIGLQPGAYKVTAEKEGIGAKMMETRVRLGRS